MSKAIVNKLFRYSGNSLLSIKSEGVKTIYDVL